MFLPDFRELYEQLLEYEGPSAYQDVLLPWQEKADQTMSVLKKYGEIQARLIPIKDIYQHLSDLYALSRVGDILLLPFQKGDCDGRSWPGPSITAEERDAYFTSLGMTRIEQKTFHPFYHEIVEVTQSDNEDEPIILEVTLWSGFMLGSLLFCRAGVRVRGGRRHIKKEIAENSTLHYAFRRKNRKTWDASLGWGSNSQWATSFRRDYEGDACYYYNVDAGYDYASIFTSRPGGGTTEETPEKSVELVVNRCFILKEELDEVEPYGMYREWKTPARFTDQCKEDKIEARRILRSPLYIYIPVFIIVNSIAITAEIYKAIKNNRNFLLFSGCIVIVVYFVISILFG
ncbi:MAG TPA: hypothetical protein VJ810_04600 [Blastocatellia bacterium]|nr:hypothetical protein [Blastocatellia bacterium]